VEIAVWLLEHRYARILNPDDKVLPGDVTLNRIVDDDVSCLLAVDRGDDVVQAENIDCYFVIMHGTGRAGKLEARARRAAKQEA
jgi:hypothetical protein